MPDIQGVQVLGVEGKAGARSTRFVVKLSQGIQKPNGQFEDQPSTFDQALANKAYALVGQIVDVRVDFSQNKQDASKWYANLVDIAPAGQLAAAPFAAGTPIQAGGGIPMAGVTAPQGGIPMSTGNPDQAAREQRICRQWALGHAFLSVSALYTGAGPDALPELKAHAIALGRELYAIGYAGQPVEETAAPALAPGTVIQTNPGDLIVPLVTDPAGVAGQVNAVMGGAVTVGTGAPAGGF